MMESESYPGAEGLSIKWLYIFSNTWILKGVMNKIRAPVSGQPLSFSIQTYAAPPG
jgi:hypothetical protein